MEGGNRSSKSGTLVGKLVGILTNRDVRFATDPSQKVSELMTKERLVTVREGVSQDEAKRLLHQFRIEKLLVVDADYHCVGLITVKDIEKAVANPNACKDEQGRLRVAAATTVGDKGFDRTERLIAAGSQTGEPAWQLPLDDRFYKLVKGDISDYKNYSGRDGSTITAAALLGKFAGKKPWIHVDIAGTFWSAGSGASYNPKGATGYGVDLVLQFLEDFASSL